MSFVVLGELGLRHLGDRSQSPDGLIALLGLVIAGVVTIGGTLGGSMVYDFGFNVETASDNHVYHVSDHDIIHPHDEPPTETHQQTENLSG